MRSNIKKFSFMIIFICWSTLSTTIVVKPSQNLHFINSESSLKFPNYELGSGQCKDEMISFNFANTKITSIGRDFISSPWITCLNFTNIQLRTIERGAFDKLPNLSQLILSNNNIDTWKLFHFGGHENLKTLIMNSASILNDYDHYPFATDISGKYPNLEILSVRINYISDLTTSLKTPFPKLKILDLSTNNIRSTNFVKLLPNNLHFLDLHNNLLKSLDFEKQMNLVVLNLNDNNLTSVHKYIDSRDNDHLVTLRRHENNDCADLKMYDQNNQDSSYKFGLTMAGLKKLRYLSISGNNIDFIESNAFEDTHELVYLNLASNNIKSLSPDTFTTLQFMRSLDLRSNRLEDVPEFSSETSISVLYLDCNCIKHISSNAFKQMPKLTELSLVKNQIEKIHVKSFAYLALLETLDLSSNKLNFLPKELMKSFLSLKYLYLIDNQFISLEALSLTHVLVPSLVVYLPSNLEYLRVSYLKNLPQNLTMILQEIKNFDYRYTNKCKTENN